MYETIIKYSLYKREIFEASIMRKPKKKKSQLHQEVGALQHTYVI